MDDVKQQIVTTASTLFLKYGLRSVSIDDVCGELRISKKTFYNYFRQKEELIESVVMQRHDRQRSENTRKFAFLNDPSQNAIDKIMKAIQFMSKESTNKYITFFYDLVKYYPSIHEQLSARQDEFTRQFIKALIQKGQHEGFLRTDVDIDLLTQYIKMQFQEGLSKIIGKMTINMNVALSFLADCCILVMVNEKGYQYYQNTYKSGHLPASNTGATTARFYWSGIPETTKKQVNNK